MAEKWKSHNRYDLYTQITHEGDEIPQNPKGTMFESGAGLFDLSGVHLLAATVDTVRQLYHGTLKQKWMKRIDEAIESNAEFFSEGPEGPWHISRIGKGSGYRYKLQNNELGITILIKRFHAKVEDADTHVKIEVSPHRIRRDEAIRDSSLPGVLQPAMDHLASWLMEDAKPAGVTVHMAVDVQGWEPGKDFMEKLVTRTKAKKDMRGISHFDLENLSEIATSYDDGQSFLFGKSKALQLAVYQKTRQTIKFDKVDYMHGVWNEDSGGWFDPEKPVWRIELTEVSAFLGAASI
jgi:hypothetical protein